jgi:hypothetical protein
MRNCSLPERLRKLRGEATRFSLEAIRRHLHLRLQQQHGPIDWVLGRCKISPPVQQALCHAARANGSGKTPVLDAKEWTIPTTDRDGHGRFWPMGDRGHGDAPISSMRKASRQASAVGRTKPSGRAGKERSAAARPTELCRIEAQRPQRADYALPRETS